MTTRILHPLGNEGSFSTIFNRREYQPVGDLLSPVPGPELLYVYKHRDLNRYLLLLWLDTDPLGRRCYLLFPVNRKALQDYLCGKATLQSLIRISPKIEFLRISKGQYGMVTGSAQQIRFSDIAENYLPSNDSFLSRDIFNKDVADKLLAGM